MVPRVSPLLSLCCRSLKQLFVGLSSTLFDGFKTIEILPTRIIRCQHLHGGREVLIHGRSYRERKIAVDSMTSKQFGMAFEVSNGVWGHPNRPRASWAFTWFSPDKSDDQCADRTITSLLQSSQSDALVDESSSRLIVTYSHFFLLLIAKSRSNSLSFYQIFHNVYFDTRG